MSKVVPKKSFWNNWKPVLVMGPAFAGLHWMWFKLQQNPKLVAKEEQLTEMPLLTVSTQLSVLFLLHFYHFFLSKNGKLFMVLFSGWKDIQKLCFAKAFT